MTKCFTILFYFQGLRPLYLQLDPSKSLLARAMVRQLDDNMWTCASIIVEDIYANDGFLETFKHEVANSYHARWWQVEDRIILSKSDTDTTMDYRLHRLYENKSRVIILHCSVELARRVFRIAKINGFIDGYAWFLTNDLVVYDPQILMEDYPVGLVAFRLDYHYRDEDLVRDAVTLISMATEKFASDFGYSLDGHIHTNGCWTLPSTEQLVFSETYFRQVILYFCTGSLVLLVLQHIVGFKNWPIPIAH